MNCKTCIEKLTANPEIKRGIILNSSLAEHLRECDDCRAFYLAGLVTSKLISDEKKFEPNPFLSTRVLSVIESNEKLQINAYKRNIFNRILQPALLTVSLSAAIFIGISMGNLYSITGTSQAVPEELLYLNDSAMESIAVYLNE